MQQLEARTQTAGGATLLAVAPRSAVRSRCAEAARRGLDIAFALVALLVFAPLLIVVIVAIRLDSKGPALFRQPRLGRGGRTFQLVKLRGMYVDARERFPELYDYASAGADGGHAYYFHCQDDPRVTRVGRIVRRYSIDELPNFWNVLRGDMSVVGPRPDIPELAYLYGPHLDRLLSVRPGVTSPSKADGRDELSFEETLQRDLMYIDERSFAVDVRTIARTITSVVRGCDVH